MSIRANAHTYEPYERMRIRMSIRSCLEFARANTHTYERMRIRVSIRSRLEFCSYIRVNSHTYEPYGRMLLCMSIRFRLELCLYV